MILASRLSRIILATLFAGQSGCALVGDNFPRGHDWQHAAYKAATDPYTWVPLIGATAVSLNSDWDEDISDWARDNNPLFGSTSSAENFSDGLLAAEAAGALVTSGLASRQRNGCASDSFSAQPASSDERVDADHSYYRDLWQDSAAFLAAAGTTTALKAAIDRSRPDGSDEDSFPSGHATSAFSLAYLLRKNLTDLSPDHETWWHVGTTATASAVAWARVEAGKHYPRDILVGAAIGNFMTAWIDQAYCNRRDCRKPSNTLNIVPDVRKDGMVMNVAWSY